MKYYILGRFGSGLLELLPLREAAFGLIWPLWDGFLRAYRGGFRVHPSLTPVPVRIMGPASFCLAPTRVSGWRLSGAPFGNAGVECVGMTYGEYQVGA